MNNIQTQQKNMEDKNEFDFTKKDLVSIKILSLEREPLVKDSNIDLVKVKAQIRKDTDNVIHSFFLENEDILGNTENNENVELPATKLIEFCELKGKELKSELDLKYYNIAQITYDAIYFFRIDGLFYI